MPETFLIHSRKKGRLLHIARADDSLCRMFSTGGANRFPDWQLTAIINPETERVCAMCRNLSKLQTFRKELGKR